VPLRSAGLWMCFRPETADGLVRAKASWNRRSKDEGYGCASDPNPSPTGIPPRLRNAARARALIAEIDGETVLRYTTLS